MKKQVVILFALCISLALMCVLSACVPAAPVLVGTPALTPSASASPSNAAISRPTQTPDTEPFIPLDELASQPTQTPIPTAKPYDQLEELATLGKGVVPEIWRSPDGSKIFLSDYHSVRVLNANDYREITTITNMGEEHLGFVDAISPSGSLIVIDGLYGFSVIDIETQQVVALGYGGGGGTNGRVFTPDGKYIIYSMKGQSLASSGDEICRVQVTEYNDGFVLDCYPTVENGDFVVMTDPAVSPNGKLVVAGYGESLQNILYIWNLEEKTILHEIKEQPSRINSVAFSPDGSTLVSAGNDGMIRLWNPATGQLKRSISGFTNDLKRVKFSQDSSQLIIEVYKQPGVIFELDSGKQMPDTPEPLDPLAIRMVKDGYLLKGLRSKLRFSPDGEKLAVSHGSIQIWDVRSQSLKTTIVADQALNIASMTYSSDGNHLAVETVYGDIYIWNIRSGRQEFFVSSSTLLDTQVLYSSNEEWVDTGIGFEVSDRQGVAFSQDAKQIAISNGPAIELWNIQTAKKVMTFEQTDPVMFPTKISFSSDGQFIYASLNLDRDLAIWNAQTGQLIRQLNLPHIDPNPYITTEMQGSLFARVNSDERDYWIEIWNADTRKMVMIPTQESIGEPIRFSADGKFVAAYLGDHQLYIWDTVSADLVLVLNNSFDLVIALDTALYWGDFAISSEGNLLATTNYRQLTLWNLEPYANQVSQPDSVSMIIPPNTLD